MRRSSRCNHAGLPSDRQDANQAYKGIPKRISVSCGTRIDQSMFCRGPCGTRIENCIFRKCQRGIFGHFTSLSDVFGMKPSVS